MYFEPLIYYLFRLHAIKFNTIVNYLKVSIYKPSKTLVKNVKDIDLLKTKRTAFLSEFFSGKNAKPI